MTPSIERKNTIGFDFKKLRVLGKEEQLNLIETNLNPVRDKLYASDLEGLDNSVKDAIVNKYIEDNPAYIAANVGVLNLKNDEEKYKLASKLFIKNLRASQYIEKFEIQDENVRLRIAKDLIDNNMEMRLLSCLDKFKITNQEFLYKFADIVSEKNPERFIECFYKFGIQDKEKRIYYARKKLEGNEFALAKHLGDFKIDDKEVLIELAIEILNREPVALFSNLEKFKIEDKEVLLDFANQIVDKRGNVLASYINKLGLDEKDRIAFAEKIAKSYDSTISANIKRFNIKDEKERIKIAKIAVGVNPNRIVDNIENYKIEDKNELLEIAKKGALNADSTTSIMDSIKYYKIDKISDLNMLFGMTLAHPTANVYLDRKIQKYMKHLELLHKRVIILSMLPNWMLKTLSIFNKSRVHEALLYKKSVQNIRRLLIYTKEKRNGDINVNFNMDNMLGKENKLKIKKVLDGLKEGRRRDYESANDIVQYLLFACSNLEKNIKHKDELTELIIELISVKKPELKNRLLPYIMKLVSDGNLDKITDELGKGNKKAYPAINVVIFENLGLYKEGNEELLEKMRKLFTSNRFTKDSKSLQEVMINLICLRATYLNDEQVIKILKNLMKNPSKLKENAKYIASTIYLDKIDMLIDYNSDDYKMLFYGIYRNYLGLNNEAFINRYENFVNKKENVDRNLEQLIMKYIALNNKYENVMKRTKLFVETLGDIEEFRRKKYNLDESEHLRIINDINPDVYIKWINGQDEFNATQNSEDKIIVSDDPVDLFLIGTEVDNSCQSIEYGGDYNKCLMGYVMDGKNKALVLKNDEGKIVARCIIKLILDETCKKVIMMKEPMYMKTGIQLELDRKLQDKCVEYAKYLGVTAIMGSGSVDAKDKERYTGDLIIKKGPTPYEYEDSAGSYFVGGEYKIQNMPLRYLYKYEGGTNS